jgi:hypothetical protein
VTRNEVQRSRARALPAAAGRARSCADAGDCRPFGEGPSWWRGATISIPLRGRRSGGRNVKDPKRLVERSYDAIADRHTAWATTDEPHLRVHRAARLFEVMPTGSEVLELGCRLRCGVGKALAERFNATASPSRSRSASRIDSSLCPAA